ncbi:TPA_asm: RNA-directed RNA polymerase [ssRNA phage Gerhypos.4_9]|uniref:RNA-directed RNA polymerase n=2 Tax=Leviviricetes TaxID=2842243 RepID=A0A8S5KXY2_9VIRU|nr:RNA-directed RNA polymerase [ssRNA phage Gerhypos.4_9]QDH90542.1 MAG: RNA-dependent RNA polymerase [Leviviridae sp.]DAD50265.1 TPA_asm: RNA-directed RNA polymerase [ssRNA phage Gerhypos.4_9]
MKSQVNNLLHVLHGVRKDIEAAYPELKEGLTKDFVRIALYCQNRGIGFFTLDLPHLESLLLQGLETGRLMLEGPLSSAVSKRIKVPRLFSGLWLRIFDKDSCLKHEVDVTALAMLRQVLVLGKKLEIECPPDRIQATVGAYHDIERRLRRPDLNWSGDELGVSRTEGGDANRSFFGVGGDLQHDLWSSDESPACQEEGKKKAAGGTNEHLNPMNLSIAQAVDLVRAEDYTNLPLFGEGNQYESQAADARLLHKIQQVADLVIGAFAPLNPRRFSALMEQRGQGIGFKHGPGAVAERLKNWEKSEFLNWPLKLQGTFPYEYCGVTAAGLLMGRRPLNHEVASRLICVPKTRKSPRLIAAESTSHQWCQQLILTFLFRQCEKLFKGSFIDFKDQSKSGEMVLLASRDRDLATVDLSDASDRLSCWTVERMFRANSSILIALHAARTRYLRDEISKDTGFLSLRKFASQGTATTFPVMSLTMLFIALGATLKDDENVTWQTLWKYSNQVRVFGDDIILPAHGYDRLLRAMELLQLKVNAAKSYVHGHFRESCGVDGYLGYDVTPLKPKRIDGDSPASCQAVVDNSNNLYKKGYWNASAAMFGLLPERLRRATRVVGKYDAGSSGLISYCGDDERHLGKRWNTRLHRYEVRVWGALPQPQRNRRNGYAALLDFFASKHNRGMPRVVSEYADIRKARIGLQWVPSYTLGMPPKGSQDDH